MLKVTASQMKVSPKPSKATVQAMPAGHAALVKRGAEADERARAFLATSAERRAAAIANLHEVNRARYAATKEEREAKKEALRLKPKRVWDNYVEVAIIQKSSKLRFQVCCGTRDGYRYVIVHEWYMLKNGAWKPSRHGIRIPLVMPINRTTTPDPDNKPSFIHPMQELIPALLQAFEIAKDMELADPDNAVWLHYDDITEDNNENN